MKVTVAGVTTPLYERAMLPTGFALDGPAIIVDASATTVVEPGWRVEVDPLANLMLTAIAVESARAAADAADTVPNPIQLEIFANRFMGIAEAMGVALQSTASSVNIKERLDFSCAVFDRAGALIANAPHMPVHLGSMGEGVAAVLRSGVTRFVPTTWSCSTRRTMVARIYPTLPSLCPSSTTAR